MADQLTRTHPLQAWSTAFDALPDELRIAPEPFVTVIRVAAFSFPGWFAWSKHDT